jgi:hypothetical protein
LSGQTWGNHIVWGDTWIGQVEGDHIVWGDTSFDQGSVAWGSLATSPTRAVNPLEQVQQ